MFVSRGVEQQPLLLAVVRKVGSMLYRGKLGLFVFFFTVACGAETESVDTASTKVATDVAVVDVAPEKNKTAVIEAETPERVLPAVSAGGPAAGAKKLSPADVELRAALNWALLEYRSAFVGRNFPKLQSIWSMGAVERLLIKKAWASCEKIDLSLETKEMRVTGRTAVVDFDQELAFLCPNEERTSHSTLAANLVKQDNGEWKISNIGDREVPMRSRQPVPASVAPSSGEVARDDGMNRALETLSDYELALQQCDLDGLSRVWIMTDLERQILQGLCFRSGQLEVSISEPELTKTDGKVSIDFTHQFTKRGTTGPQQTRSRLTALFIERADGNLAIWKIRSAQ